MKSVSIESALRHSPDRTAIVHGDVQIGYEQLHREAIALAEQWINRPTGSLIGIAGDGPVDVVSSLAAAQMAGHIPVLLPTDHAHNGKTFDTTPATRWFDRPPSSAELDRNSVVLHTSGTSGPPKAIVHDWASLSGAVHKEAPYRHRRWLLAYHPRSFAGLQVILQSVLTQGTLVVAYKHPADVARQMISHDVEFASGTPTFWRALLSGADEFSSNKTLRHITIGGEIIDQPLLDQLASHFPSARISQIYASTEQGVCFSVHDKLAGFPASWLHSNAGPCSMKLHESGELLLQSPLRMRGYLERTDVKSNGHAWFPTGDLVEIIGDRAFFRGRIGQTINVGGHKVWPSRVEEIIRHVPGVLEVRVYGIASSLVGQLAAAEVQVAPHTDEEELRRKIMAACRSSLPKYMTPARVEFSVRSLAQGDKLTRTA